MKHLQELLSLLKEADEQTGWNERAEADTDQNRGWYIVRVDDDAIAGGPFPSRSEAVSNTRRVHWYKSNEYDIAYGTVDTAKSDKFDVFKELPVNEATGDTKFDKMMGDIDAKAKAGVAFHTKLRDAAEEIPGLMEKQKKLEAWMKSELAKIRALPNSSLQRFRKELAPIAKGYREDTNLLEMLYFHASNKEPRGYQGSDEEPELKVLADDFLAKHSEDVDDAITSWLAAFEKLKAEAKEKDWPTGKNSWDHRDVSTFASEYMFAKDIAKRLRAHFKEPS